MLEAITSLVRNTLPYRCRFATSLTLRSHLRRLSLPPHSTPKPTWDNVIDKNRKVQETLTKAPASNDEIWKKNSQIYQNRRSDQSRRIDQIPATTYAGRSVSVEKGVANAYGQLQSILQRNRVQAQLRLTERHEKKGVKRRRLSSERWRKQFAHEVRKKVQLVAKIRNRGA